MPFPLLPFPIRRTDLEYPTENVRLIYLLAIEKADFVGHWGGPLRFILATKDSFADKAIEGIQMGDNKIPVMGRRSALDTEYISYIYTPAATADFRILKMVAGTIITLASEAVDLAEPNHYVKLSIAGSSLSAFRDRSTTPQITATDTSIASGLWGAGEHTTSWCSNPVAAYLLPPSSPLPSAKAIVEAEITGSGTENDPFRPNLKQELVEINKLTNVPDHLKQEAKKYEILKNKGFRDEEIKALLGYTPQYQVDLASVTWGVFDHKKEHNTILIIITADNPYGEGVMKQVEHAKSKNLKVFNPPKDYRETIEQYKQLKKHFPEWIAGKDNYAYQTLGHSVFEYFQIADTYYGRIVEMGDTKAYRNVPDWEMRRTLNTWRERLRKVNVLTEERDKHIKKIEKVLKLGW